MLRERKAFFLFLLLSLFCLCKGNAQSISYTDIKHIIDLRCAGCHKNGEIAPFALRNYKEVKAISSTIYKVINSGLMPPWLPDTSYSHFANERVLTSAELSKINGWVKGGTIKGKAISNKRKQNSAIRGSIEPDTTFFIKDEVLEPGTDEKYVTYTYTLNTPKNNYINRINFKPILNYKSIHHCNISIYTNDNGKPGHVIFMTGWTRGNAIPKFPDNVGFYTDSSTIIQLDLHYTQVPVVTKINALLNIYFTDKKPERKLEILDCGGLEQLGYDKYIPPDTVITYHLVQKLPKSISVFSIYPHMHIFGSKMLAYAINKDKDTIPLIKIDRWDFDWQEQYVLKKPLILEKDTQVHLVYTYNNSATNLLNPYTPAKPILFSGMKSYEEMLNLFLHYVDFQEADRVMNNW